MTPKDKYTNADGSYRGIFGDWDRIAWIRQPYSGQGDLKPGKEFFSTSVFPAADHPLVLARGPETRSALLTKRLFRDARFTALLERAMVNPVVLIYTDEAATRRNRMA